MGSDHSFLRSILDDTFEARRARNPGYSLRAMARDLGVSPGALSQVWRGKRKFSPKNLLKVVRRLNLPHQTRIRLLQSRPPAGGAFHRVYMSEEKFRVISEWYYLAILNLAKIRGARANAGWIGKRLGISPQLARLAIERLEKLGLIHRKAGGWLIRTAEPLATPNDVPSDSIRNHHQQTLELAQEALTSVPIDQRDISSLTLTLDRGELAYLKDMLMEFKNRVSRACAEMNPNEVYSLSMQLFPLTKGDK